MTTPLVRVIGSGSSVNWQLTHLFAATLARNGLKSRLICVGVSD